MDTNDVDIEVKNDLKVVKDGLQIEEIDITIEDAGNCKYVYVTFASNLNQFSHRSSKTYLIFFLFI